MTGARNRLDSVRAELRRAEALHREAGAALRRASTALEATCKPASTGPETPPAGAAADHIRAHRTGKPSRIDCDPELRAFVVARIERMTFTALADAIRERFPPHRRVAKSALHAWWHRQSRRRPKTHPGTTAHSPALPGQTR